MSAGLVRINAESVGMELQAPFGGMKQSSSHSREQGQAPLSSLRRLKRCLLSRNYDDDLDTSGVSYSACIICCPRGKLDPCPN